MGLLSNPNSMIAKKTMTKIILFWAFIKQDSFKSSRSFEQTVKKDPYSGASFFPVDQKGTFEHGLTGWKKCFY
jgi:hypothetical protein